MTETQCPAWSRCSLSVCLLSLPLPPDRLSWLFQTKSTGWTKSLLSDSSCLISALQLGLLLPSLFPDHFLACLLCFDCCNWSQLPSRGLSGPLTIHHRLSQLSACSLSTEKRRWGPGRRRGRDISVRGGRVPAFWLAVHQTFSPSLFSPSSFPTCLFKFHIQQMKTNTPRLPYLLPRLFLLSFFLCINSLFVSPQQGALPLFQTVQLSHL